jgi:alkylhydroperoxidase/carboxymuconolactone decarboxylase family protein YurZ
MHRTARQAAALVSWSWRPPHSGRCGKSRPARQQIGGSSAFKISARLKLPSMDPRLRELAALSALAAVGCGLAAAQGDLLFVAIFGAASIVTIIEAIRRLQ